MLVTADGDADESGEYLRQEWNMRQLVLCQVADRASSFEPLAIWEEINEKKLLIRYLACRLQRRFTCLGGMEILC